MVKNDHLPAAPRYSFRLLVGCLNFFLISSSDFIFFFFIHCSFFGFEQTQAANVLPKQPKNKATNAALVNQGKPGNQGN